MRHANDDLASADHLARLGQGLHDNTVRIGEQDGVARFVVGHVGLGLGPLQLGSCRIGSGLDLVVGRGRHRPGRHQIAVARLILRGLASACRGGGNSLVAGMRGELQISGVDTHQRLAALDGLPGIDHALKNLAGNAESQVALHPCRDDAAERRLSLGAAGYRRDPDEWRLGSRIV